jgi:hypothetical protein
MSIVFVEVFYLVGKGLELFVFHVASTFVNGNLLPCFVICCCKKFCIDELEKGQKQKKDYWKELLSKSKHIKKRVFDLPQKHWMIYISSLSATGKTSRLFTMMPESLTISDYWARFLSR